LDNRFYKINNPKDRQHLYIYINLDDISSVQYPNESLNLGIIVTKTGKEIYIQKDELDNIIKLLNIVSNIVLDDISKIFDIYETTGYFPGKNG
jgi:hypothetical protein